ncbi:DNA-directed RNA polymerase subunit beta, partial [Candidatus Pacearchaeota archaeon]|nr:DNA-directed RNA polymerase subunit beta [Candidatus Pacearchaeota archaeon]
HSLFKQQIYDPLSKTFLLNPIAVGYMYFFRMVHIAEEKIAARGIGTYAKRTLQPLGGRKNKGGQRIGEMEMACIVGHDAPHNLFEFFTTKSDCIDLKNEYIRQEIETDLVKEPEDISIVPESVKLLNSYLTVIGVDKDG